MVEGLPERELHPVRPAIADAARADPLGLHGSLGRHVAARSAEASETRLNDLTTLTRMSAVSACTGERLAGANGYGLEVRASSREGGKQRNEHDAKEPVVTVTHVLAVFLSPGA